MSSIELKEKRTKLLTDAKALLDSAEKEKRSFSEQEQTSWDTLVEESENLKEQINKEERSEYLAAQESELKRSTRKVSPSNIVTSTTKKPAYGRALKAWLTAESGNLNGGDWEALNAYNFDANRRSMTIRAQETTDATYGQALVSPDNQFLANIERALKQYGAILQTSTIIRTDNGNDLPWPISNDVNNLGYQIAQGVQDTTERAPFQNAVKQLHRKSLMLLTVVGWAAGWGFAPSAGLACRASGRSIPGSGCWPSWN